MKSLLKLIVFAGSMLLGGWLIGKVLPLFAPFLCSLAAAALMEPAVAALNRRGVRRSLASGLMTAICLLLLCGLCCGLGLCGAELFRTYAKQTPHVLSALSETADDVRQHMLILLRNTPDSIERELLLAAEGLSDRLSELPVWLSEQALNGLTAFAKQSPDWVLFLCTSVIGIYFFSAYFPDINRFFRRQLSSSALEKLTLIRSVTYGAVAGYLKVQCIISAVTFLVLLTAFHLMGIDGVVSAAAGIAIVDALPILGSGAVLLPWAGITLLRGKLSRAAALLLVYGLLLVLHNLLQAKLMGRHLGLHPVTALVSLYVGWKLGGLGGMLLLPIVCVLLTGLNEAGIIRLYQ